MWIDALTNYLTALGFPGDATAAGGGEEFKLRGDAAAFWPGATHVVGKDILRFHAVYWPALLMAAGLPPPRRLFAHGWWTKDGAKISKSLGNVVKPFDLVDRYGLDATRYFLLSGVSFGADGDFSDRAMLAVANAYLANSLGNMLQRALTMVHKHCGGAVPAPTDALEPIDAALLARARALGPALRAYYAEQSLSRAQDAVRDVVTDANKYFDETAPWTLAKSPDDAARFRTVLYVSLETMRCVALAYQPAMPRASARMLELLGVGPDAPRAALALDALADPAFALAPGAPLPPPAAVFPRVEEEGGAAAKPAPKAPKPKAKQGAPPPDESAPLVTWVEFKVGEVTRAWAHADAENLYCEEVDVGEGAPREIASGLRGALPIEQLEGAKIIVVTNLKPRKLVGFKSHGMVLCAARVDPETGEERVELVTPPPGARVGEVVTFEGLPPPPPGADGAPAAAAYAPATPNQLEKKKVWDRVQAELATDAECVATWAGHRFMTSAGPCTAATIADGTVR